MAAPFGRGRHLPIGQQPEVGAMLQDFETSTVTAHSPHLFSTLRLQNDVL